jgi:hypothetical protein
MKEVSPSNVVTANSNRFKEENVVLKYRDQKPDLNIDRNPVIVNSIEEGIPLLLNYMNILIFIQSKLH